MKILNVTPEYFPASRGGEWYAKDIPERLAARGHEVIVLTTNVPSDGDPLDDCAGAFDDIALNGVRVVRIPATEGRSAKALDVALRVKGGYRLLSWFFTPAGLEFLTRYPRNLEFLRSILSSEFDVVVSWNWYWPQAYYAYLANSLRPMRLVGVPCFDPAESWARQSVYDRMIAACDGLVVNTYQERDFVLDRTETVERMWVLTPGIHAEFFSRRHGGTFRVRHGIGSRFLVGFMGTMSAPKVVDRIVEAMSWVWTWNSEACLALAGVREDHFARLSQLLQSLNANQQKRLLLLPNLAEGEKADFYDALDIFVMPSVEESLAVSYLEAWVCRKPVIGPRVGSAACVIDHGNDGILIEPLDPRDIALAIMDLLSDPVRRWRMGERGHTKAIENFTWEKIGDGIEKYFVDLVADTPMPHLWQWPRFSSGSRMKRAKSSGRRAG
jgi:glycosyltransferase involved in cell wall biosynthesis